MQSPQAASAGEGVLWSANNTGMAEACSTCCVCGPWTNKLTCFLLQDAGARNEPGSTRGISAKASVRRYGNKHKYIPDKQKKQQRVIEPQLTQPPPVLKLEYAFGQRLQDAQRVEDLFEVIVMHSMFMRKSLRKSAQV